MATAKRKFQKLVFNPSSQKLVYFLNELQRQAKDALEFAALAIIEQFIKAEMPPHLKKSINQTHLEKSLYEQIVPDLEQEIELTGLEAPGRLQVSTVSSEKTNPTCNLCIEPAYYNNQYRLLKKQKNKLRTQKTLLETATVHPQTVTPTRITKITITSIKMTEK